MPRNVTVTLDDGTQLEYKGIPDDVTKEQFQARVEQDLATGKIQSQAPAKPGKAEIAASGLIRGANALPALIGDIGGNLMEGAGNLLGKLNPFDLGMKASGATDAQVQESKDLSRAQGPLSMSAANAKAGAQPTTTGEKYLASAAEGLGGAFLPGQTAAAPIRSAITGVAAGLGAEAGGQLTNDSWYGRLLGSLAGGLTGGGAAALASRARPQSAELAKEATEGLTDDMIRKAQAFQAQARQQGVDMDLAQALESVGAPAKSLATVRDVLANSRHGDQVKDVLRKQSSQLEQLGDSTVGGLPGPVASGREAAHNVATAATQRIQLTKDEASKLWKDTLNQTRATLRETENLNIEQARIVAQEAGIPVQEAQKQLRAARNRLLKAESVLVQSRATDRQGMEQLMAQQGQMQQDIQLLQRGYLPRGRSETNRGALLDAAGRGASIDRDLIGREVESGLLQQRLQEMPLPGSSMTTQQLAEQVALRHGGVANAERRLTAAQSGQQQAMNQLGEAVARRNAIDTVPIDTLGQVDARLRGLTAEQPSTKRGAGKLLADLRRSLYDDKGQPLQDANKINEALKGFSASLKSPDLASAGVDRGAVNYAHAQVAAIREQLGAASEPFRKANQAFSAFNESNLDPLRRSVVGDLAGRRGQPVDVAASVEKLNSIFSRGSDPQVAEGVRDIPKMFNELRKVDPEAVPAAAKAFIRTRMDAAFQSLPQDVVQGAVTSNQAAKVLQDSLFKSRAQWQGMRDIGAGIARSYDLPEDQVVRGLENFMQITKGLASSPAKVGGLNWDDVAKTGGQSALADAARIYSFAPFNRLGMRIEDAALARTFRDFDQILTTPQGADLLIQLSTTPIMSQKAILLLNQFGASAATAQ